MRLSTQENVDAPVGDVDRLQVRAARHPWVDAKAGGAPIGRRHPGLPKRSLDMVLQLGNLRHAGGDLPSDDIGVPSRAAHGANEDRDGNDEDELDRREAAARPTPA